eukprot:TRINITY_DN29361_c0_g1_i1.p1 TRINITY_DN29361_c0_g1~~TRINITY_DN29361_c0_g1_i1.p1  ORF type:complete len:314 (+),score=24.12 TRINITY_DN29361_c0_g1_i1:424-1365(+)
MQTASNGNQSVPMVVSNPGTTVVQNVTVMNGNRSNTAILSTPSNPVVQASKGSAGKTNALKIKSSPLTTVMKKPHDSSSKKNTLEIKSSLVRTVVQVVTIRRGITVHHVGELSLRLGKRPTILGMGKQAAGTSDNNTHDPWSPQEVENFDPMADDEGISALRQWQSQQFQATCFLLDLNELMSEVQRLWRKTKAGKLSLLTAASVTNVCVTFATRLTRLLREDIPHFKDLDSIVTLLYLEDAVAFILAKHPSVTLDLAIKVVTMAKKASVSRIDQETLTTPMKRMVAVFMDISRMPAEVAKSAARKTTQSIER